MPWLAVKLPFARAPADGNSREVDRDVASVVTGILLPGGVLPVISPDYSLLHYCQNVLAKELVEPGRWKLS